MKHRLSLWTGRRDARGSTTRVGLEAHGIAAMVVVSVALVLAAAVALCALLREPRRGTPPPAAVDRAQVTAARADRRQSATSRARAWRRSTWRSPRCLLGGVVDDASHPAATA